jgi:hypothetical protein
MAEVHTGGCLCQGVRYEFFGEPLMTVNCYCGEGRDGSRSHFREGWQFGRLKLGDAHAQLLDFSREAVDASGCGDPELP